MRKRIGPKVIDGKKWYPCCSFEGNQHKLDYWNTHYANEYYDKHTQESYDKWDEWQKIFKMSSECVIYGIMYFPYPEFNTVREGIAMYDLLH